ncbi:hypothetical protein M0R45_002230 [Rubus argutus]|uniref:Uncharacterized protein n=1 Tax=Rubus argutus TaxID=59490 RepID=A0AAW1VDP0_RUBAR
MAFPKRRRDELGTVAGVSNDNADKSGEHGGNGHRGSSGFILAQPGLLATTPARDDTGWQAADWEACGDLMSRSGDGERGGDGVVVWALMAEERDEAADDGDSRSDRARDGEIDGGKGWVAGEMGSSGELGSPLWWLLDCQVLVLGIESGILARA